MMKKFCLLEMSMDISLVMCLSGLILEQNG
jgi:hypothetical protein